MAKYIVTSGTNFNPFTYDELVKPLAQMTEAHNEAQARYDELASNTAQLERYLDDNPDDNYARDIYNNYMSRLQTLQDNLYQRGFGQSTARDLSVARTAYARDIVPMTEAVGRRRKWSDAYKQMQIEHPEMIMGRDPASYSLRDYMEDTNFGGFKNYSTSQLTKDTAVAAAAAAKALAPRPRVWDTSSRVPAGYAETEMTTGYTAAEVDKAMNAFRTGQTTTNDERADELLSIANTIYSQSGLGDWQSESPGAFDRAAAAIGEGMRSAIGETKYEMIQRRDGIYSPAYRAAASKAAKATKDTKDDLFKYWELGGDEVVGDAKAARNYTRDLNLLSDVAENYADYMPDSNYVAAFDTVRKYKLAEVEARNGDPTMSGTLQNLKEGYDRAISAYPELSNYSTDAFSRSNASLTQRRNEGYSNAKKVSDLAELFDAYNIPYDQRNVETLRMAIEKARDNNIRRYNPIIVKSTDGSNQGAEIASRLGISVNTSQDRIDDLFHVHNTLDKVNKDDVLNILKASDTTYGFTQRPGRPGSVYARSTSGGEVDIDASAVSNVPIPGEILGVLQQLYNQASNPALSVEDRNAAVNYYNAFTSAYPEIGSRQHMDYLVTNFPEFANNIIALGGDADEFKAMIVGLMSKYMFHYPNSMPQAQGNSGTEHRLVK